MEDVRKQFVAILSANWTVGEVVALTQDLWTLPEHTEAGSKLIFETENYLQGAAWNYEHGVEGES